MHNAPTNMHSNTNEHARTPKIAYQSQNNQTNNQLDVIMAKLSELDNIKAHLQEIDQRFTNFNTNGFLRQEVPDRS